MRKRESIILWKRRFTDRKASGLKVYDWCEKNNISKHAYYYWHRKIQEDLQDSSEKAFVEIPVISSPENWVSEKEGITIVWKEFTFQIHSSQDVPVMADLMKRLVKEC